MYNWSPLECFVERYCWNKAWKTSVMRGMHATGKSRRSSRITNVILSDMRNSGPWWRYTNHELESSHVLHADRWASSRTNCIVRLTYQLRLIVGRVSCLHLRFLRLRIIFFNASAEISRNDWFIATRSLWCHCNDALIGGPRKMNLQCWDCLATD